MVRGHRSCGDRDRDDYTTHRNECFRAQSRVATGANSKIFKGLVLFIAADVIRLGLLVLFPALTLWL